MLPRAHRSFQFLLTLSFLLFTLFTPKCLTLIQSSPLSIPSHFSITKRRCTNTIPHDSHSLSSISTLTQSYPTEMSDPVSPLMNDEQKPKVNVNLTPEMVESFRPEVEQFLKTHNGKLKMLLLVRKDLGMTQGKIAAQCGHAAMGIVTNYLVPQHELMLLPPQRVENNWEEDVEVFYQPGLGETSDSDDEDDEEYSCEEPSSPISPGPRTILEALQVPPQEPETKQAETTAATTATATTDLHCMCPLLESPSGNDLQLQEPTPVPKSPHEACENCGKPGKPNPNDPSTRYLRYTPRQIRQELYKTTAPIEILMKHIIAKWIRYGQAKIALKVNSDGEMSGLLNQLRNQGIPFYEIYDAGLTQIAANTRTVVAVGPFPADIIDPLLKHLKLL